MVQYYHTFDLSECESKDEFYYEVGKLIEHIKDEVDGLFYGMTKDKTQVHLELWMLPEKKVKPEFFSEAQKLQEKYNVKTIASGFMSQIVVPKNEDGEDEA